MPRVLGNTQCDAGLAVTMPSSPDQFYSACFRQLIAPSRIFEQERIAPDDRPMPIHSHTLRIIYLSGIIFVAIIYQPCLQVWDYLALPLDLRWAGTIPHREPEDCMQYKLFNSPVSPPRRGNQDYLQLRYFKPASLAIPLVVDEQLPAKWTSLAMDAPMDPKPIPQRR